MAMTLGGRAAEEIVFGEITTGASNDLEKVTETAKQMVMRFGMSERLGPRVFGHDRGQPFLGREFSTEPDYSDEIAREIDDEIRRIVEAAHQTAKDLLTDKREELDTISKILLERETIDAEQFVALLDGKPEDEVFVDEEEPAKPVEPAPSRKRPSARARGRSRARAPATPAATPPSAEPPSAPAALCPGGARRSNRRPRPAPEQACSLASEHHDLSSRAARRRYRSHAASQSRIGAYSPRDATAR